MVMRRAAKRARTRSSPSARARGFGDRLVWQADDREGRHAGRDLHLDIDGSDLDALERYRGDALDRCAYPACQLQ